MMIGIPYYIQIVIAIASYATASVIFFIMILASYYTVAIMYNNLPTDHLGS